MKQMKILISGAGITGNALAFWLAKLGHKVTVVEVFPDIRASGLQIDLRGHGVEVMKRMGLEQAFRSKSIPEQGMQMVDSSGRRRAYFPANDSSNVTLGFSSDWEIMRGDLCHIIYDLTKTRAKYLFATSIDNIEEEDGLVNVRLSDGATDHFDLVIGADGQNSRTRKMMLGPDGPDAFHSMKGMYVGYFTIPQPIQPGEDYMATSYTASGSRGIMTRRHNNHEIQVYIGGRTDSDELKARLRGHTDERKEALSEMLRGAGWRTDEMLESLKHADNFYCDRLGQVKLDSWSRGRVVLVGDAAYCPSPATGMGTTSGLVGAYVLAGEIGRHCGPGTTDRPGALLTALRAYDDRFRPFMAQVQKGVSLEEGRWDRVSTSAFGVAVMNYFMGIASFLRLDVLSRFTSDTVKDWNLPEYEELYHG